MIGIDLVVFLSLLLFHHHTLVQGAQNKRDRAQVSFQTLLDVVHENLLFLRHQVQSSCEKKITPDMWEDLRPVPKTLSYDYAVTASDFRQEPREDVFESYLPLEKDTGLLFRVTLGSLSHSLNLKREDFSLDSLPLKATPFLEKRLRFHVREAPFWESFWMDKAFLLGVLLCLTFLGTVLFIYAKIQERLRQRALWGQRLSGLEEVVSSLEESHESLEKKAVLLEQKTQTFLQREKFRLTLLEKIDAHRAGSLKQLQDHLMLLEHAYDESPLITSEEKRKFIHNAAALCANLRDAHLVSKEKKEISLLKIIHHLLESLKLSFHESGVFFELTTSSEDEAFLLETDPVVLELYLVSLMTKIYTRLYKGGIVTIKVEEVLGGISVAFTCSRPLVSFVFSETIDLGVFKISEPSLEKLSQELHCCLKKSSQTELVLVFRKKLPANLGKNVVLLHG